MAAQASQFFSLRQVKVVCAAALAARGPLTASLHPANDDKYDHDRLVAAVNSIVEDIVAASTPEELRHRLASVIYTDAFSVFLQESVLLWPTFSRLDLSNEARGLDDELD